MNNANKIFFLAFSILFFCIGVYILIYSSIHYKMTLEMVRDSYKDNVIYEQYNEVRMDIVPYPELIASLCIQMDCDIRIDDLLIEKNASDPEDISGYSIKVSDYTKSYVYDDSGSIEEIVYTSISE